MATKLKLPSAFTDTSLPKFQLDPVMPDAGALMLIDPLHLVNPWAAGVPADSTVLPNIAETQALATLGSSTVSDVRPVMKKPAAFTGTAGLLERTSKGGLHGIVPQGGTGVANSGPSIYLPTPLTRYMLQNKTHKFYLSMWARHTRKATATTYSVIIGGGTQQTNADFLALATPATEGGAYGFRPQAGNIAADATPVFSPATYATNTPWFGAVDSKSYYNSTTAEQVPDTGVAAPAGTTAASGVAWGSPAATPSVGLSGNVSTLSINGGSQTTSPSFVLYRLYLEDLTVSGRTFSAVQTLDQAQFAKDLTTAGGRYYGDTFTDPATLP